MSEVAVKPTIGQSNTEWLKQRLQTILTSSQFCGLCLESKGNLCSVYIELVISKQEYSKNLHDIINYVFNDDIENFMCSSLICDSCLEKTIQSYLFIHNTKESSKVVNNCVYDLNSKVIDINEQLDVEVCPNSSNVLIVLENDKEMLKNIVDLQSVEVETTETPKIVKKELVEVEIKKEDKPKNATELDHKLHVNESKSIKPKKAKVTKPNGTPNISLKEGKLLIKPLSFSSNIIPNYNVYQCMDCTEIFTNYRLLKEHEKSKHKKTVFQCNFCNKCYNTQQYLNIHYKTHSIARCKLCQRILPEKELMGHLRSNHAQFVYPCKICELVYYSSESLDTHFKISHAVGETRSKTQCIMCLRNFVEVEPKTHRCKFSCSECFVMPCIHYAYLKSYREQVLNHANEIKCIDCDYQTRRKEHLIGHINREHLDHHPFTCAHCAQQFYTKLSLKIHIVQFHQNLCCEYCEFKFKDANSLENHKKACKAIIRLHRCNQCDASFDLEEELQRHANLRHNNRAHSCTLCKSTFLTQMEIDEHHARVHSGIQPKKRRKHIECSLCDKFFKNLKELDEHEKLHNSEDVFPCKECPKVFDGLRKLYIHNQKHYTVRIVCPRCSKKVASSFYKQHSARCPYNKKSPVRHVCEVCGKSFYTKGILLYHQKSHKDPEPCPECDKILKPNSLRKHMEQVHGEERRSYTTSKATIACDICNHVVRKKTDLEAHMNRYHLKIKPYTCDVCSKTFCGKTRLKDHMATHTTDNMCYCSTCGKKFANRVCLKMHVRMHTGEAPYACDICGQTFRSSSMMKTHRLKKHLDKNVSCPLCENMYYMVRDMRHHFKKVHWKYKDRPFNPREVKELDESYYHLFEDGRLPNLSDNQTKTEYLKIKSLSLMA